MMFSPLRSHDTVHNDSLLSRGSQPDRSIDQSAFLHGNAQVVKVAAKKLREIRSPFDAHVQSSYDSVLRDSQEPRDIQAGVLETTVPGGGSPAASLQTRITVEKHAAPRSSDAILGRSTGSRGQSLGKTADDVTQTVSDSGFASRMVRDGQHTDLRTLNSTSAELASLMEEGDIENNVVVAQHGACGQLWISLATEVTILRLWFQATLRTAVVRSRRSSRSTTSKRRLKLVLCSKVLQTRSSSASLGSELRSESSNLHYFFALNDF